MEFKAIDNLKIFTLKEYPNNQFVICSQLNKSKIYFDCSNNFIRLNKKIEEKEISSRLFSFFIGVIEYKGLSFFLFAPYVRYMAKVQTHKFYQIVNVNAIAT